MAETFFDSMYSENKAKSSPLAERMRPKSLDGFYGQEHITADGKLLRRMIVSDRITSMIFYGPPGVGKTTLAKIIASSTKSEFVTLNAVTSGVKDIKDVIDKAKMTSAMYQKRTILFIDEIHRFNKAQQDALLPGVEDGTLILIGATTQNPYFEINAALVSRCSVFNLRPLNSEDVKKIVLRTLSDKTNGLGLHPIEISDEAIAYLGDISGGDARVALNALELAFLSTPKNEDGFIKLDLGVIEECVQKKAVVYDKDGDNHYDIISAFIKSLRGSDPDAAIYYLAKMLYAGEDPKFIARRMVVFASEDVSLAENSALGVAVNAFHAVEIIGLPECRLNLAHAAIFLALCPKCNSTYMALNKAEADVSTGPDTSVPYHLRNRLNKDIVKETKVPDYKYPHSYPNHYVRQEYLPEALKGRTYYVNAGMGEEKALNEALDKIKQGN